MSDLINRRAFLKGGVGVLGGLAAARIAGPALLDGRGALASLAAPKVKPGTYGHLTYVGAWVPNAETAGEYVAVKEGYWTQQGFSSVKIIPSGPLAPPQEVTVETGKAFVGNSGLDATTSAILKGFGLVVIGAQLQQSAYAIMSLASSPIKTPQEMIGKKIGVGSSNDAAWYEFLSINHINQSELTTVPVGFDPLPLTQHTVDAWYCYITNEPIFLELKGFKVTAFLLADYGLPEVSNIQITTKSSVANNRDRLKAFLIGEIMGWHKVFTDPTLGATLSWKAGTGLSYKEELLQVYAEEKLQIAGDAMKDGFLYVNKATQEASLATIALSGKHLLPSQVFDMSLLDEIYTEYPSLKVPPTPVT